MVKGTGFLFYFMNYLLDLKLLSQHLNFLTPS
ncbi:hypothetical protein EV198_0555 [Roseivirga ehrenbergii]|nr:hypothetical protein EV198_0555 [Roseivirga ehrenbergii]